MVNSVTPGALWYYALSISSIAGTIIGVGMFGLPYIAQQSGFFLTVGYLLFFGVIVGLCHLLYTEITLRTKEDHRFTGYVGYYLGPRWKTLTLAQGLISLWGTLLVYTIVAAKFFLLIFPDITLIFPEVLIGSIFFAACAFIVWGGDASVGKQELLFVIPVVGIIVLIFLSAISSPAFSVTRLSGANWSHWIAPYGITLFALAGFSSIPMLEHILAPAKKKGIRFNYPFIVMTGTFLPAILYILFVWAVLGVDGVSGKTEAPLADLIDALGGPIVIAGALLGIFAIHNAFIAVGNELQKTFIEDYKLTRTIGFLGAMSVPFALYLLNIQDFIAVADFVGTIMGGYIGVMVVVLFWQAQKRGTVTPPFSVSLSPRAGWFMIGLFTFASLYALATIISPLILAPLPN